MNKEQKITKFELAVAEAIRTGQAANRPSARILGYGTIYDQVKDFDFDLMALSFPRFRGRPGYIYAMMADSIEANPIDELADIILEDIDESIDEDSLPVDPAEFEEL